MPVMNKVKFLGLTFDKSLKWGPHITELKAKAGRAANLLRIVTNTKWGADTRTSLLLYKMCIRPILDYGAIIYMPAAKSNLKKLETIQNQCLRIALGAFPTSPIRSLQIEANIAQLNLRREYLMLRYCEKVQNHPGHPIQSILQDKHNDGVLQRYPGKIPPPANRIESLKRKYLVEDIETKCAVYISPPWCQTLPTVCNRHSCISKSEPHIFVKQQFSEHSLIHPRPHIYTDGSGGENNKGASVYFPTRQNLNKEFKLPWAISIFTAEAFAIKSALEIINKENMNTATIFTDSKSVLQAIEIPNHPNEMIAKIVGRWEILTNNGFQIHFCWSPGHVGIAGNEEADKRAKDATMNGQETQLPITIQEFSSLIIKKQKENWQNLWHSTEAKLKVFKPKIGPLTILPVNNRREEAIIRRLRIGHTNATHEYLVKDPRNNPTCVHCGVPLSVNHILYKCQHSPFLNQNPQENDLSEPNKVQRVIQHIVKKKISI